jgi:hypothetical protein
MMDRAKSMRWLWLGAAILPMLVLALVAGTGIQMTAAQDATPATGEAAGRPAHIHSGSCAKGQLGDIVQPLTSLTKSQGPSQGQNAAVAAETSFTNVPLTLDQILAADHAINIHRSQDKIQDYIACGEIGGTIDPNGSLVIGLKEQNNSGFTGIAVLTPNADGVSTDVSVFIAKGLTGGKAGKSATPAVGGVATPVA